MAIRIIDTIKYLKSGPIINLPQSTLLSPIFSIIDFHQWDLFCFLTNTLIINQSNPLMLGNTSFVLADNTLYCSGLNDFGQFGFQKGKSSNTFLKHSFFERKNIQQLVSSHHTLIIAG